MEALTQLMSLIDLNSKSLPEGDYLEMCNKMKDIYKVVPRPTSPEAALPRVQTRDPFQPVPLVLDDPEEERISRLRQDLWNAMSAISRANRELKQRESRLKYLKIKQRVTATVRKDAVRERAQQLGVRLRQYTIEELRAKGHHIANERSFYRGYLDRQNLVTQGLILDIQDEITEIIAYREEQKNTHYELYQTIYGRPPISEYVV